MSGLKYSKPSKYTGGFYNAITTYRIARYLKVLKIPFFPKLIEGLTHLLFSSVIPSSARIGKGTFCSHRGMAVVIHKDSSIGRFCVIGTSVVLGGRSEESPGAPVVGDCVYIGTGAKLIGPIKVGDGAKIGANSVVLTDVPEGATVVGIPARVIPDEK